MESTPPLESVIDLACPRCGQSRGEDEFYGVCGSCRSQLRMTFGGEQRDVEPAEYEPKMNVTPNAVASKE